MSHLSGPEWEAIQQSIGHRPGGLYEFYQLLGHYFSRYQGLEEDYYLTVMEAYILASIVDNPGITASDLTKQTLKTKGFISQTVKKLKDLNLISRKRDGENMKFIALFPTEEGIRFRQRYMDRDSQDASHILQQLLEQCTAEELKSFYKVVYAYSDILAKHYI